MGRGKRPNDSRFAKHYGSKSLRTQLVILRRLWGWSDRLIKQLTFLELALVLAGSVVSGLAPLLFKYFVDGIATAQPVALTVTLAFAYVAAQWTARTLREWRSFHHGRIDQRATRLISAAFFRHIMMLPLHFHTTRKAGALSQALANGLVGFRLILHHVMLSVLPVVIEFIMVTIVLLLFGHAIFLVLIGAAIVLYTALFWVSSVRIKANSSSASDASVNASAVLTDAVMNYQTVKYFGIEEEVHARFVDALDKTERDWSALLKVKTNTGLLASLVFSLTLAASLYIAIQRTLDGQMTIGELILVNAYVFQTTQPLETIGSAFRDISQGMAFLRTLRVLFEKQCEVDVRNPCRSVANNPIEVRFEHVSYAYEPDRWILKDLSLVVPAGRIVALVGPSGSGKSSLVRLLLRVISPTAGQVVLAGQPLSCLSTSQLRRTVTLVPQDIELFNASIAFNITLGNDLFNKHSVIRAAKIARIHDFVAGLAKGYETIVGNRGLRLSGGEKQRLAIARAVIRDPSVYVFDEATSCLDSETERGVLRDVFRILRGKTALLISHRLSTVVQADEIVVLRAGFIAERGTHSELLKRGALYSALWDAERAGTDRIQLDEISSSV
ncbi:MAG: ATP-binding cassette domain-containing protein [Pseudomonadales bacterium]